MYGATCVRRYFTQTLLILYSYFTSGGGVCGATCVRRYFSVLHSLTKEPLKDSAKRRGGGGRSRTGGEGGGGGMGRDMLGAATKIEKKYSYSHFFLRRLRSRYITCFTRCFTSRRVQILNRPPARNAERVVLRCCGVFGTGLPLAVLVLLERRYKYRLDRLKQMLSVCVCCGVCGEQGSQASEERRWSGFAGNKKIKNVRCSCLDVP